MFKNHVEQLEGGRTKQNKQPDKIKKARGKKPTK
jgi:hypothetical protein